MTWSSDLRWRAIALYVFMRMPSPEVGMLLGVGASTVREWAGKQSS
jgi:transposase